MIHYERLNEIRERLSEIELELNEDYSSDLHAMLMQEQTELTEEQELLTTEQSEYRDGYDAGREYHIATGKMLDSWCGRTGPWRRGFEAAGQDS